MLKDTLERDDYKSPEEEASLFSRYTFSWMNPVIKAGFDRPLELNDIFELSVAERTSSVSSQFDAAWDRRKPHLLNAIAEVWGSSMLKSGLWKLLNDASQFTGPMFMAVIIGVVQNTKYSYGETLATGMTYAALLFACQVMGAIGEGQYFQLSMRSGMKLKSALISAIFSKSMRLTNAARQATGTGKLTNIMSSDVDSLQAFAEYCHVLWSAPLRIICSLVLLYLQLGAASLAGAAVLIAFLPLQGKLVIWMGKCVKEAQLSTDERLRLVGEAFGGIQLVKCYAWEGTFDSRTRKIRSQELGTIKKFSLIRGLNFFTVSAVPVIAAVASFAVFVATSPQPLTGVQAFTTISLFAVLRFPLMQLPSMVNQLSTCRVALGRVRAFLLLEETPSRPAPPSPRHSPLMLNGVTFKWEDDSFALQDVSFAIQQKELIAVVGKTGSGKSTLLRGIIRDLPATAGQMSVADSAGIAYAPQSPWIFSGTIRDNIVLGEQDVDDIKYKRALEYSCLSSDLQLMQHGDMTEIGDRGVTLSGGQKQRVSLARVFYARDANLAVLDDPLSALDTATARAVFEKGILGDKSRPCLFATNRLEFAAAADRTIVLDEGKVVAIGPFASLRGQPALERLLRLGGEGDSWGEGSAVADGSSQADAKAKGESAPFIKAEERSFGAVSKDVVVKYTRAMGTFELSVLVYTGATALQAGASFWLASWSSSTDETDAWYFLKVYAVLNGSMLGLILVAQLLLALGGVRASSRLYSDMMSSLFGARLDFFQATPAGRIMNRCSKDTMELDRNLASALVFSVQSFLGLLGTLTVVAVSTYWSLLVFVPILILFWRLQAVYRATSREVKRSEAVTRSPVLTLFAQALDGVSTIRAFSKEKTMVSGPAARLVDRNLKCVFCQFSSNRWLGLRLECFGGILVFTVTTAVVVTRSASFAGIAISSALAVTGVLGMLVRVTAMVENSFNSVERIDEFSRLPEEIQSGQVPPASWPSSGLIEFRNVTLRYRPGLQPALDNVSFSVRAGEKLGIVGRTGAGKSTLLNALFRLHDIGAGQIFIDNIDIATLKLSMLRSSIGVIPQDPIVFAGTLRYNVDPFDMFTDEQVAAALAASHLHDFSLSTQVGAAGSCLSAGQRQLVCLARVLLKRTRILLLDEATAALDPHSDALVEQTVAEQFQTSTVLTIAHRLQTVIRSDRVAVLGFGNIIEIGSPSELLRNAEGAFTRLVEETGPATASALRLAASK